MKKIALALLFTTLTSTQVACSASSAPNVQQYIAQRGWSAYQAKSLALPVTDIAPVMYMAKGSLAPSCGLLTQAGATPVFLEILSPEEGSSFPQCLAINDVAAFDLNKKKYLVFEYINRDTQEDFYRQYFYVYKDAAGRYVADSALNESDAWPESLKASATAVNPPRAQDGVKRARGAALSKVVPGMKFMGRDFLQDDSRSFAVFQDKAKEKCAFVVDAGATPVTVGHEAFAEGDKCSTILASSKLEKDGTSYYLAMFKGAQRNHLAVVSVNKENAIAIEKDAALAAGSRDKLVDMKGAKKALLASMK